MGTISRLRLDDLYKMVCHIYSEQNAPRPASVTFGHFVEICGMLTIHDRQKKREGVSVESALCKALGWYFPLVAKFNIASVEELVFRKYPYACPYCRKERHEDMICKTIRGTDRTVNHAELRRAYRENRRKIPITLDEWQLMFQPFIPGILRKSRAGAPWA